MLQNNSTEETQEGFLLISIDNKEEFIQKFKQGIEKYPIDRLINLIVRLPISKVTKAVKQISPYAHYVQPVISIISPTIAAITQLISLVPLKKNKQFIQSKQLFDLISQEIIATNGEGHIEKFEQGLNQLSALYTKNKRLMPTDHLLGSFYDAFINPDNIEKLELEYFQTFIGILAAFISQLCHDQYRSTGITIVNDDGTESSADEHQINNDNIYFVFKVIARLGFSYYLNNKTKIIPDNILQAKNKLDLILDQFFKNFGFKQISDILKDKESQLGIFFLKQGLSKKSTPLIILGINELRKNRELKAFFANQDVFNNLGDIIAIMDPSYRGAMIGFLVKPLSYVVNPILGVLFPIASQGINIAWGLQDRFNDVIFGESNSGVDNRLLLEDNRAVPENDSDDFEKANSDSIKSKKKKSGFFNLCLKYFKKIVQFILKYLKIFCKYITDKINEISQYFFNKNCFSPRTQPETEKTNLSEKNNTDLEFDPDVEMIEEGLAPSSSKKHKFGKYKSYFP